MPRIGPRTGSQRPHKAAPKASNVVRVADESTLPLAAISGKLLRATERESFAVKLPPGRWQATGGDVEMVQLKLVGDTLAVKLGNWPIQPRGPVSVELVSDKGAHATFRVLAGQAKSTSGGIGGGYGVGAGYRAR